MASSAKLGIGAALKIGDGASPEVFATVANVTQFDISKSAPEVDVTNLQSPGRRREYIGGLIDGDTITVNFHLDLDSATQNDAAGIIKTMKNGETRNFRLDWSAMGYTANDIYTFPAVVTALQVSTTPGEAMSGSFTLREAATGTWS